VATSESVLARRDGTLLSRKSERLDAVDVVDASLLAKAIRLSVLSLQRCRVIGYFFAREVHCTSIGRFWQQCGPLSGPCELFRRALISVQSAGFRALESGAETVGILNDGAFKYRTAHGKCKVRRLTSLQGMIPGADKWGLDKL
jgi:hypothetical protein